jgi:MFS family permease
MAADHAHDPYAALRAPGFRAFLTGNFLATLGRQAVTAAAAWEIYDRTKSGMALGLVGLVNVLPLLALSLPAGALADRADRRRIIARAQAGLCVLSAALAALSLWHARVPDWGPLRAGNDALRWLAGVFERHPETVRFEEPALPLMFALLFLMSCLRVLSWPARSSIIPRLLPRAALGGAITWNSSAFEIATIGGPALAGFVVAGFGYQAVYVLDAALGAAFCLMLARVRYVESESPKGVHDEHWLAGARFIWSRKVILGASALDLFAVLLGGAVTTLLPVFAAEVLHVGKIGLGWLQAAQSVGAVSMALWLTHRAPLARPGRAMLWSVVGFGAAVIVFGLSPWFWLSFAALVVAGACDNISVVVRQSLVQFLTPDALRGRVTAVNQVFIGTSNEAGALRAGLMEARFGPMAAVVAGGIGTLAVVGLVAWRFAPLRRLKELHTLRAE